MQSHVLCCPKVTTLDELQERAPSIECTGHVYLTGVQFLMQIECACVNVWRSAWEGDTVPCPCGPSRCTSVHMLFWSHTHLAYPGSDQVASHETPSQMIARQIHVCCKKTKRIRQQITYWFAAITKGDTKWLAFCLISLDLDTFSTSFSITFESLSAQICTIKYMMETSNTPSILF